MLSYINPFPTVDQKDASRQLSAKTRVEELASPCSTELAKTLSLTSIQIPASRDKRDPVALAFLAGLTSVPSGMFKQGRKGEGKKRGKKETNIKTFLTKGKDGVVWNISAEAPPKTHLPKTLSLVDITVCQEVSLGTILTTSTVANTFASYFFVASSLGNFSNFASIYDQYKVHQLELWLHPEFFGSGAISSLWTSVIDLDDATNLATYGLAGEYETAVETLIAVGHYRKWVPHIAVATYSGVFTSFKNEVANWIDAASPSVQHYGVKLAAQPTAAAAGAIVGTLRCVISFRSTH